jgi:hypothetical protein
MRIWRSPPATSAKRFCTSVPMSVITDPGKFSRRVEDPRPDQSPVQLPGGAGNGPGGSAGIRPEKGPGGGWGMTHCTM